MFSKEKKVSVNHARLNSRNFPQILAVGEHKKKCVFFFLLKNEEKRQVLSNCQDSIPWSWS